MHIFQKNLTNHSLIFCAFGRKTQIVGKFWKFLMKILLKIEFLFYFILFYFYFLFYFFIFRKFVTKNRVFGNNTSFLQQFFRFRGGGFPPPLPQATPLTATNVRVSSFSSKRRWKIERHILPPSVDFILSRHPKVRLKPKNILGFNFLNLFQRANFMDTNHKCQ